MFLATVRSSVRRGGMYSAKMKDFGVVGNVTPSPYAGSISAPIRDLMVANFVAYLDAWTQMEQSVKTVLNYSAVANIQYAAYLCFGREMAAMLTKMSGDSAAKEAGILVSKWVARGLTQAVLIDIRSGVFNVPAPVAP